MNNLENLFYLPTERYFFLLSQEEDMLLNNLDILIKKQATIQKSKEATNSSIQVLPDEILLKIFSYLNCFNLARVGTICRRFSKISKDDSLWLRFFFYPLCTKSIYLSEMRLLKQITRDHKDNVKSLFITIFKRELGALKKVKLS